MDSDELDSANASLFWLDETAFDAECLPIESLDFATFSGDVVPRDGIQRPILIGSDAPRPRAPRAPREQPVHVTHVHQTVIQSTLPVVQVHAATGSRGHIGPHLPRASPFRTPRLNLQAGVKMEAPVQGPSGERRTSTHTRWHTFIWDQFAPANSAAAHGG